MPDDDDGGSLDGFSELVRRAKHEAQEAGRGCIWAPYQKQETFLAAPEFEVLYGGAAGGAKTDALLIDALGLHQQAMETKGYQALLIRRTYPDLRDMIERSLELYPAVSPGARYHKNDHVWEFPGGGKVEFGHLQYDIDRFRYRGRAFQYLGIDELTLFPTPASYVYLFSRVRTIDPGLKCYIRSTTNPDGPGFGWVKRRWQIPDAGTETYQRQVLTDEASGREFTVERRFIPARLEDNPALWGGDYLKALLLLPPEQRKALRLGRWDDRAVEGAYYARELERMRNEGRIGAVPYQRGVPVNTFWDLGHTDTTAIWFHQRVALQDRWLHCYENSGESLSHFSGYLLGAHRGIEQQDADGEPVVNPRSPADMGYSYGIHYLPHDAAAVRMGRDPSNTKSWKAMLQELMPGGRFELVKRTDDVLVGIEQTRGQMDSCWIDEEGCRDGIAALLNYHKQWDEERESYLRTPVHDWSSNFADAFRQWGQSLAEGGGALRALHGRITRGEVRSRRSSNWRGN